MTRPLTPPEVRELLDAIDSRPRRPQLFRAVMARHGASSNHADDLLIALNTIPAIRATLERYAELAEEKGE